MKDGQENMVGIWVREAGWARWIVNNQLCCWFGGTDVLALLIQVSFDGGCGCG